MRAEHTNILATEQAVTFPHDQVKICAPELLRERRMKASWGGERLNVSGITDPYQPPGG